MHRFPQIASPLHIEPEIRAVAEHAGENESGCGGHIAAIVAKLIDVFALQRPEFRQSLPACVRSSTWPASCIAAIVEIYAFRLTLANNGA
jgi:hypothetical protein